MSTSRLFNCNTIKGIRFYSSALADEILTSEKGKCLNITLNRPKALNSLNPNMVKILTPKYLEWRKNKKNGDLVIVMKGSGEKAFCAGGDIRAIYDYGNPTSTLKNDPKLEKISDTFFREEYFLNHLIGTNPIPQVSIYNGITMGGGVGLSVHGKFRVATDNTLFAMPETGIGFFCDVGGSYFLSRLPHRLGYYLALTGAKLKGKNVYASGIATHFVKSENIPKLEEALEQLSNPTNENVEQLLNQFSEKIDKNDTTLDINVNIKDIERIFSKNSVEEIIATLEKENTDFAINTLKTLKQMSPTALKVVFEQLNQGKSKSLAECLKMEFRMSQTFMENTDFFEGVRALLVDKDKNPKWNPDCISKVSDSLVQSYFKPIKNELELLE
ncbi:hypothetical protein CYY_006227 [Polysphondylium violaceum]|uniref:3-hydroxyisobutyryl-CoA hydrolase n=1 Tax=Polysphondylium violaceum TaxID=133409 RepID=A0A8J4URM5_9MYCE|nr:hypothetical protein CYY_006227 [Polysphondylium violaceum]